MIDYSTKLKEALLAKDSIRLSVIRCLKTEISKILSTKGRNGKPIDEKEELALIRKEIKKREESISMFTDTAAIAKETAEKEYLESFLPTQLSESEIDSYIDQAIAHTEASTKKDIGIVLAMINSDPDLFGRFDPKEVSRKISSKLQ